MKLSLLMLFAFLLNMSFAQVKDSAGSDLAKAKLIQQMNYQQAVGHYAPLYNGSAYVKYWNREIGHPFFDDFQYQKSTIYFNGFLYQDILLKYDLVKNQLVILNATGAYEMELLAEHVSAFKIGLHEFIKIGADSIHAFMPGMGFYEILYKGKSTVIAKYQKHIEASLKAEDNTSMFVQRSSYYIRINSVYHLIENSTDFLLLHKDQKVALRKFMNKEKLRFSKDPEKTLVSLAAYFDTISHE